MSALKGWGLDPEGVSTYGSAAAGVGVSLVSAVALATHRVRVNLSAEPKHASPYSTGDALNPNTWVIQRLDSNAFLTVVDVEPLAPDAYALVTLEAFGAFTVAHLANTTALLSLDGTPCVAPHSANFQGVLADGAVTAADLASQLQRTPRDLANFQSPSTTDGQSAGTLVIKAGDYATMQGDPLVKKLVYRRLSTRPGAFYHLPNYGLALAEKEPLPPSELPLRKAQIEKQLQREPEIDVVTARLTMNPSGVLTEQVRCLLKATGLPVDVTKKSQPGVGE